MKSTVKILCLIIAFAASVSPTTLLAQIITTFAGTGVLGWYGDGGPATAAEFSGLNALISDGSGNIYVCDADNNIVRKINTTGIITLIAGNGTAGFSGDGGPATAAKISHPSGLVLDAAGNLFICDYNNQVIRKVDNSGVITTIAGTPMVSGYTGDGGAATAAKMHSPYGLSINSHGDLYFADMNNHAVRKITKSTGIISTVCGNGASGFFGDGGPATAGKLSFPNCVNVDIYDNLYISDNGNLRVRMVNASNIINTVAGGGTLVMVNGVPATSEKLYYPAGMKLDKVGNLYFGNDDNTVRKVNTSGIINIFAGTGTAGYFGDGGAATVAYLHRPNDVAIDPNGNIFIADLLNSVIREVPSGNRSPSFTHGHTQTFTVCENSSAAAIDTTLAIIDSDIGQTETWVLFTPPAHGTAVTAYTATSTGAIITPIGLTYTPTPGYSGPDSFQVKVDDGISIDITTIYVTIIPTLVDVIVCPSSVCVTSSVTATDDTLGGVWSISNSHATIGSGSGIVTGVTSGLDTISYSVTNACGTTTVTTTINVNSLPNLITGTPKVCVGGTTTLSDATSGGSWISNNIGVATIGTGSGLVTGVSVGTAIDTFKIIATGCYATITITVNPLPGPITGTPKVCIGGTTTLSDATSGGSWISNNIGVATIGTGSGLVTGVSVGTVIDTFKIITTGCYATITVTVNPTPGPITGIATVCVGATTPLTDLSSGGTWTSTITIVATVGSSDGHVFGVSQGTSTISYYYSTGCAATRIVTVYPIPADISPVGPVTICSGTSFPLSDATSGGVWSSTITSVATVGTSGIVNGVGVGTSTISYTNSSGCAKSKTVTVLPGPALISPSSASVCPGNTTNLSDGVSGGVWGSSNTNIATVGTSGTVTGVLTGTATISYSIGSCLTTATVTVLALPNVGSITGVSSLCAGSVATLTDGAGGGVWSSTNTSVCTVGGTGIIAGVSAGTTTISYTVTAACTAAATHVVTVNPLPSAGVITGPFHVCNGSTISLTDAAAGGVWSSSNTVVSTVSAVGVVTGASVGTDNIIYTVTNGFGCSSSTFLPDTVDLSPAAITPAIATVICAGTTANLSDATGGGAWSSSVTTIATVVGGLVTAGSPGTTIISYKIGNCSSTKSVTVNTAPVPIAPLTASVCPGNTTTLSDATGGGVWSSSNTTKATIAGGVVTGVSAGTTTISYSIGTCSTTATVTVNAAPAAITPSGAVSVCIGSTVSLSDATPGGIWSSSATTIATVIGGLVTGISLGTVNIAYTNGFGCAALQTVSVLANPAAISPSSATVCSGGTTTLSDATGGGVWSSGNTTIASVAGGVVTGVSGGTATISYTTGSCYATATVSVVNAPAAITPLSAVNVCSGTTTSLSDAVSGGAWSSSSTATATVAGGIVTGFTPGTVTITYAIGGCSVTKTVTVVAGPAAIIPSSFTLCTGNSFTVIETTGGGTWSSSNIAVATVNSGGTVTGVTVGTATITYTTSTCYATATVTINLSANAGVITGLSTVCSGSSIALTDAASGGVWSSSNIAVAKVGTTGLVTGISGGTATISYTVTNTCGSTSAVSTVTVNTSPSAGVIIGPASICAGTFVVLSDATTGGVWSITNSHATLSGTGLLTGVSVGLDTIKYTITTACGTTTATKTVSIGAFLTAGTISGPTSVCSGVNITLTDPATGGTWSSSNTTIAKVGATGIVTGVSGGTDTIYYTVTAVCGTAKALYTVTVVPSAISGAITGPAILCAGTTATYTDATAGGIWSTTNPKATINAISGLLTGVTTGTDTIRYSITNSCGTSTMTKTITIGAFLTAGSITGASGVCAGSSIALTDATAGGVWSSSNANATVTGTGSVTGVSGGVDTIIYTMTSSCGTATATHPVTVTPLPNAGSISGPASVCVGSAITLSDGSAGGVWSSSNAHATISAGGIVTPVSAGTDTISYTVTNICGTARATKLITIGTAPTAGTISGPAIVCTGTAITLTDATTGGIWSISNANATIGTTGIVTGVNAGLDTVSYTVSNFCGSAATTALVTVNALPNAGSITGASSLCGSTTVTLSDAMPGGIWSSSNGHATISSGGVVTPVSNGTDTIIYSVTNLCGTATATKTITIGTAPSAGTISGPAGVCIGSVISLTDATGGGVWSSSNANATVSITGIVTGMAVGLDTISYTVSNSCGTASATAIVTVGLAPNAGSITGPSSLCAGSFTIYTDGAPGGVWSSSNTSSATITAGGVVTAVTAFTTDTIRYTVTNACGSATATKVISIGAAATAGTIAGPTSICIGTPATMSDGVAGGVWSSSNGSATISPAGVVTGNYPGVDTIYYTVTGSCGVISTSVVITINSFPNAGTISGASAVCVGSLITMTDGVAGGAWSSSNADATITTSGVVTGIASGTDTINYTVTNACGIATTTKIITISPFPGGGSISGPSSVCVGSTITLSDAIPGGVWSSGGPAIVTISAGGVVTGVSAGASLISYTVTNACGTGSASVLITVNPAPNAGTISGPTTVCGGSTISLTDAATGGVWSAGNANATVTGTGVVTGVSTGTDPISYTVSNACGTVSAISIITINTTPSGGTISGPAGVCAGSGITLTDPIPGGTWSASNSNAAVMGPGIIYGITVGVDTIYYTVTNSCGTGIASKIIPINPVPVVSPIGGPTSECVGTMITLTDGVPGGIWTSSNPSVATIGMSTGIVTGVSTGTTIITYTVTNAFGCPTSVTYTDTVNTGSGLGAITGATSTCAGSTVTLSNATAGGTWSSSNPAIATVGASTGIVTGMSAGTVMISYTAVTSCGSATVTQTETINASPNAGTITGLSGVCAGSSITLSDAAGGGVWSSTDPTVTVGAGTGIVTGLSAGVATITYTVTNACGTASATKAITISSLPVAGTISGASIVCTGASISLTDPATGGIWTASNGNATVTGGLVTGVSVGTDTILYVVSNACGTASATKIITINPFPFAGSITGPSTVCIGKSISVSDLTPGGVWSSSNTLIATVTPSGLVTGVSAGTSSISYTVTNSCGTNASTISVKVLTPAECTGITPAVNGVTTITANTVELRVYPNPNNGVFTMDLLSENEEQVQVTITNIMGQKVKEFTIGTNQTAEIKLDQPSGIYILSAIVGDRRYMEKITVE